MVRSNARDPDSLLVRAIGPWSLGANAVNLTIGVGIFALPALVATRLGQNAWLAYVVCSAALALVVLCLAEAGTRIGRSGGVYAYIETAFGPLAGFVASVVYWGGFCIPGDAAVANILIGAFGQIWTPAAAPILRMLLLLFLFAAIAALNILGVRNGARTVVVLTVAKLLPLVGLIALGLFAPRAPATPVPWPTVSTLAQASLLLFFAFPGPEGALTPSGEIERPARTIPRAIFGAVVVIFAIYLGVQYVSQWVLGTSLAAQGDAPLAAVAGALWGPNGKILLLGAATLSGVALITGDVLANSRLLFASAEDRLLPRLLTRVHPRFRTPYVAIIAYAAMGFLLSITGGFAALATLASAAILLVYLAAPLALLKLRRDRVSQCGTPFIVPGGPIVPLLATAVVFALLSQTPFDQLAGIAALISVAVLLYLGRALLRRSVAAAAVS